MKNYFIRLFEYDRHTNHEMVRLIKETGEPEKTRQIMAHMLGAQQVWLSRIQSLPAPGHPIWPDWKLENLDSIIDQNHKAWIAYLESITDDEYSNIIEYKTSTGDTFRNRVIDIIGHVVNHGTHHRAQIGQQVKLAGLEKLPLTDYILYLRQHE